MHEALQSGKVALVTGGASGIGREIVARLMKAGMQVAVADLPGPKLEGLLEAGATVVPCDVAEPGAFAGVKQRVETQLGKVSALFLNAGIQPGSSIYDAEGNWDRILGVNLMGVVRGAQVFAPDMAASGREGLIVITGSKQGITTPPGDPAYNVSKAGVKAFAEALQHELRGTKGCRTEARLFIPGWVHTPLTARGRTEKPEGAWTPAQVVDFLMAALEREDFYILCPDGDVDRRTDEKRIAWAAGDITENRPPLSRWHGGYDDAFKAWVDA
ncbi:SDR family NAD(P)-dependent oxidoreductase [Sagittula salina]|uniref:SDR family oxidoreductase n=1 Tax=Sagittula salina TaxID=2820268 RepID=A0A940S108_9RHOB|nr:SDR family oxidoreductase [Sagittula salina]MBP0482567.1 SDR family oxidoreductase [Sagittula salina]